MNMRYVARIQVYRHNKRHDRLPANLFVRLYDDIAVARDYIALLKSIHASGEYRIDGMPVSCDYELHDTEHPSESTCIAVGTTAYLVPGYLAQKA